jgi:hypothetical protein
MNCLRSKKVTLSGTLVNGRARVEAKVLVKDELGQAVADAMVGATWTWPNGTTHEQIGWTNAKGRAKFDTADMPGLYRLEVSTIIKSLHTFNPAKSTLVGSVTVP